MEIIGSLEVLCWLVFVVVWFVTSFQTKRNLQPSHWWQSYWIRIVIFIILFVFFRVQIGRLVFTTYFAHSPGIPVATVGLILTALGIAFAIWARTNLGTNWGMPMSLKAN